MNTADRELIKSLARAAVDAGRPIADCPYQVGTLERKCFVAEYFTRECEVNDAEVVSA